MAGLWVIIKTFSGGTEGNGGTKYCHHLAKFLIIPKKMYPLHKCDEELNMTSLPSKQKMTFAELFDRR